MLTLPDAPFAALDLVRAYAPMLLRAMGGDIGPDHPCVVARPYPLYTFPIEAVLGDHPLALAQLVAWEYLIIDNESIAGLAEVAATDAEGNPRLAYATLHTNRFAKAIASKIVVAEQLPAVRARDYQLRILRVPSLTALAIWLSAEDDILLPIEEIPSGVPVSDSIWKGAEIVRDEAVLAALLRPIAYYRLNSRDY